MVDPYSSLWLSKSRYEWLEIIIRIVMLQNYRKVKYKGRDLAYLFWERVHFKQNLLESHKMAALMALDALKSSSSLSQHTIMILCPAWIWGQIYHWTLCRRTSQWTPYAGGNIRCGMADRFFQWANFDDLMITSMSQCLSNLHIKEPDICLLRDPMS